jgi:urease accessory protein
VRAHAELHLERSGGRDRLTRLRSQAPLVLRMHGRTLHLVGGAAGPLAGDETRLCIRVGAGAHLRVRSVAATVALPGAGTAPSTSQTSVRVGAGAVLDWAPEPLVLAAGSHHRAAVAVTLEPSAVLRWREVVVLGRHQERPGCSRRRPGSSEGASRCWTRSTPGAPARRAAGTARPASEPPASW